MPQWTPEQAQEMARRGGEARARNLRKSPEERAREAIRDAAPDLMAELLKAAKGEGEFGELSVKDRVDAIKKALEYGIGRPTTYKAAEKDEEVTPTGVVFE